MNYRKIFRHKNNSTWEGTKDLDSSNRMFFENMQC